MKNCFLVTVVRNDERRSPRGIEAMIYKADVDTLPVFLKGIDYDFVLSVTVQFLITIEALDVMNVTLTAEYSKGMKG